MLDGILLKNKKKTNDDFFSLIDKINEYIPCGTSYREIFNTG